MPIEQVLAFKTSDGDLYATQAEAEAAEPTFTDAVAEYFMDDPVIVEICSTDPQFKQFIESVMAVLKERLEKYEAEAENNS